ncbi:MAG: tyrosine-type recombinase/integrase [Candidatus Neomarinimicrobiota bacterium]
MKSYPRSKKQPAWLFQYKDLRTGKWTQRVLHCTAEQAKAYQRKFDADHNYLKMHPEELRAEINSIVLQAAIKQFIKLKSADKAYATIIKYRNILGHFRDMLGDSFPVEDIDNRVIEQFKLYYLNEHSKTGTNMALRHLKVFIYWCYDKEYLVKKPKFEMLKTAKRDVRWLTKEEYFKLYEIVPQEVKDVMTFCVSTGARIREILERPWKDFNFKDNVIILDANIVKGRYQSALYMNSQCIGILKRIKSENPASRSPFPYTYDYINFRYQKACKIIGIKSSTHDWRRSAGAWLLQEGVSIYHVSRFLRHCSTKVTEDHYADLVKKNFTDLSEQLNSILTK